MTMRTLSPTLNSWASEIDTGTVLQAERTSRLPILAGPMALMPDAHVGIGATVGSVIPTDEALIPAAVGVDLGCGVAAVRTDVRADQLPDDLGPLLNRVESVVPAGVGQGWSQIPASLYPSRSGVYEWMKKNKPATTLTSEEVSKSVSQLGTLGSGNHFVEVCVDETDRVWLLLHSGSRGIGNILASKHIKLAKLLANENEVKLEDPDLAWFVSGTPQFLCYVTDMLWAQEYAKFNRQLMMNAVVKEFFKEMTGLKPTIVSTINCHHNFCQPETHFGKRMWVTRKGAIKAGVNDLGVIPGSMGTKSYVVKGKGNPESYNSCSHGAGRLHSRSAAKKIFSVDDLARQMEGKTWLSSKSMSLLDEIPSAYKDIDQVMADQEDLVEVLHVLRQVLNYKGA